MEAGSEQSGSRRRLYGESDRLTGSSVVPRDQPHVSLSLETTLLLMTHEVGPPLPVQFQVVFRGYLGFYLF